jgi:broad specificity phosphatase PhoE
VVACFLLLAGSGLPLAARSQAEDDAVDLWRVLAEGHGVAMIRHALAPGIGDPAHFDIDDCDTQRNLSDPGREQARRLGSRFHDNGIHGAAVYSSQWCRCMETAELLDLGPVSGLESLNSFFRNNDLAESRTESLRQWLLGRTASTPLVLVTHQVNIRALTGSGASSGEMVVLRLDQAGAVSVLGRISTPY